MSKAAMLRAALLELLAEHERDGMLPTSARFLFYELVARGIVSKERKGARRADQDATDALTDLRQSGKVPWDWIADETRAIEDYSGFPSIKEAVLAYLPSLRLDPWRRKTVLVMTESRSLAGVLRSIATRYRIQIAATGGQIAGFLHTEVAPLLLNATSPKVLYMGDHDLAGNQIETNTRRVLERETGDLDWRRIALTKEQVEEYDLPVIVKHDRRYKDGRPHEAVETEALSQRLIVELLDTELTALLPEPLERVHEREERQRRALRNEGDDLELWKLEFEFDSELRELFEAGRKEVAREEPARKEAGRKINPATAEIYWHFAWVADPYCDYDPRAAAWLSHWTASRCYFARVPGGTWVCFDDLPEHTRNALQRRLDNEADSE